MGKSKDGNVTCFMYTQMRLVGLGQHSLTGSVEYCNFYHRVKPMGRTCKMTWEPSTKRWRKMHKGKIYLGLVQSTGLPSHKGRVLETSQ